MAPPTHPYIPNSAPATKAAMLESIGFSDIEELYTSIPAELRLTQALDLAAALPDEYGLRRHLSGLLARNVPTHRVLSFLGAGCYPHYVPTVCDEVNSRAEFLTAYAGEPYEDHGKWQAIFEYTSLMAELLEMDVVSVPTYDGFQAVSTALRMGLRLTGRHRVLVPATLSAEKRAKIDSYLEGAGEVLTIPTSARSGRLDEEALAKLLDEGVAAVLIETPNALGVVETGAARIAERAHAAGAVVVASIDPISLGFLEAPARWGADIVCGDIQSLGLGLHYGGANGGFLAVHDEERFVFELPSRLFGLAPTSVPGELGFTDVAYERTSLAMREEGIEWVGTAAALWGITAGVYLALLGPQGIAQLGGTVAANTRYAIEALARVPGIEVPFRDSAHWRELLIRFPHADAAAIDATLREQGILGFVDRTTAADGAQGLVCVTEIHTTDDINRLVAALEEAIR